MVHSKIQKQLIYDFLSGDKRLLIVLDACRYDLFIKNIDLLDPFIPFVSKVISLGSCTRDWLINTFTKPINAVYITANPWVTKVFKNFKQFKMIDDVSARYWDNKLGTVRAEYTNLVALKYLFKRENLIVHYLQPHAPFVKGSWLYKVIGSSNKIADEMYKLASKNRKARREFKRAYVENLRYVLKYAKKLALVALRRGYKIVITSDHSELLGVYAPIKFLVRILMKRRYRRVVTLDNMPNVHVHQNIHSLTYIRKAVNLLKNWLPYAIGYYRIVDHPCMWPDKELYEVPWAEIRLVKKGLLLD